MQFWFSYITENVHLVFPTLHCMSQRRLAPSLRFITDPLLAALSSNFDPTWVLAPDSGRLELCAPRHTTDGTVHAHTLVLTAGPEALTVTVEHAVILAACSHHIWQRGTTSSHMLLRCAESVANAETSKFVMFLLDQIIQTMAYNAL